MSHMESSCRKISAHDQWKTNKREKCQEKLFRKIPCTQLDRCLNYLTGGKALSHWKCSHGPFSMSVSPLSGGMRGHLFVFPACIFRDDCDASSYCEQFGHPCWLDDSYTHWGWTCDSHLCIFSNIIVRFNADVHQAHKELNVGWGNLTYFQVCIENF